MKGRPVLISVLTLGLVLALAVGLTLAQGPGPQGDADIQTASVSTSFTYQGRLNDGGSPANGTYDFEFIPFYAAEGGGQACDTLHRYDVVVTDGLFTVELDFGSYCFMGDDRWLEIRVRPGGSTGAYTTLAPRQALTATPYALYALNVPSYSAGEGLTLADTTFSVDFAGSGTAATASRSDHDHWGETWSGNGYGLILESSDDYNVGLQVLGGNFGVHIVSPGGDGVIVYNPGEDGVFVWEAGRYGVYASTTATYGFYTPDKIFAGAGYDDIAEHIDAAGDVEAGDVVVIDPDRDERVVKSTRPYDTSVAGIISTDPALLIGKSDTETPLALAGRAPCKVSAENGPIHRGDLLTTSSTPGHAMKATEPQLGTIVGKALGELESGTGVIPVLITLQ